MLSFLWLIRLGLTLDIEPMPNGHCVLFSSLDGPEDAGLRQVFRRECDIIDFVRVFFYEHVSDLFIGHRWL